MVKQLLKSVREFKKDALLTPFFVVLEVVMEVLIPFVMAELIDKGITVHIGHSAENIAGAQCIIRTAAAHHGGTVLIDQPEGVGTRITMTMSIRQSKQATLRSNVLRVDYAGERDHGLIELSECLPTELYE